MRNIKFCMIKFGFIKFKKVWFFVNIENFNFMVVFKRLLC